MENFGQSNSYRTPRQGDSNVRRVVGRAFGPGLPNWAPTQPGFAGGDRLQVPPAWRGGENAMCSERLKFLREQEG